MIDSSAPELARFARTTGQVKTVNMNGRCLVEFDQFNNTGWYDIDPACLKIVPKPLPKPAEEKAKPAAKAAPAKDAAKPAAKAAAPKKASTADILAAARGKAAAAKPAEAKPVRGDPRQGASREGGCSSARRGAGRGRGARRGGGATRQESRETGCRRQPAHHHRRQDRVVPGPRRQGLTPGPAWVTAVRRTSRFVPRRRLPCFVRVRLFVGSLASESRA